MRANLSDGYIATMRGARSLKLLLPVLLLAPVAGVVDAASAAETSVLTIKGRPGLGVYHDDIGPDSTPDVVRHRGRLTADGAPVVGASVHLQRKLVGGEWLTVERAAETDDEGRYVFLTAIEGNARYRASYEGDVGTAVPAAVSGVVRLKAMRDFNADLVEKERKAILKGDINPGWEQRIVQWQRRKCKGCDWKTIAEQRSGDNGTWRFAGAYPPVGKKWVYRAAIGATDEFVRSYSAKLVTTTTPAREPVARAAAIER